MALRDAGWKVIAGARSFAEEDRDGMRLLPLDVTDEKSVEAFVDRALEFSPRVSALVQCAGILMLGSCEETSPRSFFV